jgi:hypothetical protein
MAEERIKSTFEMLWDCEFCETKGLLGKTQRHCPECGAQQNADKRYFPKEGSEVQITGHSYEGSDHYCPNCNSPQGSKAKNCTNCGAPQTDRKEVKGVAIPVTPKKKRPWWLFILIAVVVIVGIVFLARWCNRTEDKAITVTAHRWERSIAVEQFGDDQQDDWRDRVPRDARGVSCRSKQRTTKQIPDGETCKEKRVDNKDGTGKVVQECKPKFRSEPVMDEFCRYTVTRWKIIDTIKTAGTGMTPEWPKAGLPPETAPEVHGAKRRGKKTETFFLDMEGQTCDVSEAVWRKHADKAKITVQVKSRTGDIMCDSL